MITKIVHLADIHIRRLTSRHEEYREVFERLYNSLNSVKPDRIVIVGDLMHDFNKLEGESVVLASEFLNRLSKISKVIITRGNHDVLGKNSDRVDSIEAIVRTMNNNDIVYYNETNFFEDDNVVWAVWKHGEKNNNPWEKIKKYVRDESKIYIDLFHDPINAARTVDGYEFNSKIYHNINDFQGDYSFFGDQHLLQFITPTKAYSSSLIEQNFAEANYFHGYLLWDIINKSVNEIEIPNDYSFRNLTVTRFTNFDDLDLEIDNPTKHNRVRVIWKTLPAQRSTDNERKIDKYVREKYNPQYIKHKNNFVEDDVVDIQDNGDLLNIYDKAVSDKIFRDYLEKIGESDENIIDVLKLDDEITSLIPKDDVNNIQWKIVKVSGQNFRSYKDLVIDFKDNNGIYQIQGANTAGKSTLIGLLSFTLFGKTLETDFRQKNGDSRFINKRINVDHCQGDVVIESNGVYYGVRRIIKQKKNKDGEVSSTTSTLNYYKLINYNDEFATTNNIENLNDEDRKKTQKYIDEIIGSYDNFNRIVLTTSDTLNHILSSDKSEFIDSILFDSGLNIFDQKLTEFKKYVKLAQEKNKVFCNVEQEEIKIKQKEDEIVTSTYKIDELKNKIIEVDGRIIKGESFKTETAQRLNNIQLTPNIPTREQCVRNIDQFNKTIIDLKNKENDLNLQISKLKESYDSEQLQILIDKKERNREEQFALKSKVQSIRMEIQNLDSSIIKIDYEIQNIIKDGKRLKEEISGLENSKTCPTCNQLLKDDAITSIQQKIEEKNVKVNQLYELIKSKESEKLPISENKLLLNNEIIKNEEGVKTLIEVQNSDLEKIGQLQNDKIEYEKRQVLINELSQIPLKIENANLNIKNNEAYINEYNSVDDKLKENESIKAIIKSADDKLNVLRNDKDNLQREVSVLSTQINYAKESIKNITDLINRFKQQEKIEKIYTLYQSCIHRDGIPTRILSDILIPKINKNLSDILSDVEFDVWIDPVDLRLKLSYATYPESVIDCISASGKEKTFSSISLKFALNDINMKSKPKLIALDEVAGRLDNETGFDEFIQLLKIFRDKVDIILIIEHNRDLQPDYVIKVESNNGISSLSVN